MLYGACGYLYILWLEGYRKHIGVASLSKVGVSRSNTEFQAAIISA
jgi:hypothetical protein